MLPVCPGASLHFCPRHPCTGSRRGGGETAWWSRSSTEDVQNVTMGRDPRIPGRIYRCNPPHQEPPPVKKPLAALLLSVATVAALAVPAGAATRTTWRHYKTACPSGRNGVIVTEKWQGGEAVQSWVTNTCGK